MSLGRKAFALRPSISWRLATAISGPGCHPGKGWCSVRKERALLD